MSTIPLIDSLRPAPAPSAAVWRARAGRAWNGFLTHGLPPLVIELKTLGSQFTCPPTSIQPAELLPILRVNGSTTLPAEVLAMVAEPVRIEGTLTTVRGVPVIDTTTTQITRATR